MYASQAKYFKAYSSVRDSQVGYWFNLQEHPEIDQKLLLEIDEYNKYY